MTICLTCYVIDYDCNGRVADVRRDETSKPFLTGSVPQLQSDLQTSSSSTHTLNYDSTAWTSFEVSHTWKTVPLQVTSWYIADHQLADAITYLLSTLDLPQALEAHQAVSFIQSEWSLVWSILHRILPCLKSRSFFYCWSARDSRASPLLLEVWQSPVHHLMC